MHKLNDISYAFLEKVMHFFELFGLPLSLLAWITVFVGSIGMLIVLRKYSLNEKIKIPIIVGLLTLIAHLADYYITLKVSPDLSLEANPLWRNITDSFGLNIAKWYGLTGKIFLSILSFQFFTFYLIKRDLLFPEEASNILSFYQQFGRRTLDRKFNLENMLNYFSFMFALLGPFYFYIALLNSNSIYQTIIPAAPLMLVLYLFALTILYFILNYFRGRGVLSNFKSRH